MLVAHESKAEVSKSRRTHPPDTRQHALLGGAVVKGGVRNLVLRYRSGRIDGEHHRDLSREGRILLQLYLVAILDFVLMAANHPGNHVLGKTSDHNRLSGHDSRAFLGSVAQVERAVSPATTRSQSLGAQSAHSKADPATPRTRTSRAQTPHSLRIAHSSAVAKPAQRIVDTGPQPSGTKDV